MGCPRLRRTFPDAPRRFILVAVQVDGLMPWNERVAPSAGTWTRLHHPDVFRLNCGEDLIVPKIELDFVSLR